MKPSLLQSYLLAEQLLDREQLALVEEERAARGLTLPCALISLGLVDPERLAAFLSARLKLPCIEAGTLREPARWVAAGLDAAFAVTRRVLPVARRHDELTLVMSDPTDTETAEEVERRTGATVLRAVALETALDDALELHYGRGSVIGPTVTASGELRELFGGALPDTTPIPLTQLKLSASAATSLHAPMTDLENLVTAPLPRIDFPVGTFPAGTGVEPPPLPADLDDRPSLPPEAYSRPRSARGADLTFTSATKTQPFPAMSDPALSDLSVVDEYEVSCELPATSLAPQLASAPTVPDAVKVDCQLPTTVVDARAPRETPAQLEHWALGWLGQIAGRRLILCVEGQRLDAWAAAGFDSAAVGSLHLPVEATSLFARVLESGETYVGPLPFGRSERHFASMVGRHARELLLAPIADQQGVVGLIYCDDLHTAVRPGVLQTFASKLATQLRRLG